MASGDMGKTKQGHHEKKEETGMESKREKWTFLYFPIYEQWLKDELDRVGKDVERLLDERDPACLS